MALAFHSASHLSSDPPAELLVIGTFEGEIAASLEAWIKDKSLVAALVKQAEKKEFTGKKTQTLAFSSLGQLPCGRLLLVGLGAPENLTNAGVRVYGASAGKAALAEKATMLAITLPRGRLTEAARYIAEGVELGAYRFTKYFTGDRKPKRELSQVTLLDGSRKKNPQKLRAAAAQGHAIARAIRVTRDLQNEPPNQLTPAALADAAVRVAKHHKLKVTVFDRRDLEKLGAHLLVAVGRGSRNEPRLVHLVYRPKDKKPKRVVALVGKGITFDSGGLCIKPAAGMGEMKSDMSGAANVIGVMAALATLQPNVEVHGILGCAENMPDGDAYRPGDVFPSLDGKTIEIINTDAEGRLILADCLTYARKFKPDVIINNATLTGACIVALGPNCSAYYATHDDLAAGFGEAAKIAGEQFWRMPLLEDLRESLKSDVADLKHTGDRYGGSITAALFLKEFVGDTPFVHCDIAGPSFASRAQGIYPKGGTGHGVLTFLQFLTHGVPDPRSLSWVPPEGFRRCLSCLKSSNSSTN